MSTAPILCIKDLTVEFPRPGQPGLVAVDGVSLDIHAGEVMGLVGESGSGKSMLALSTIGLIPATGRAVSGQVLLNQVDLLKKSDFDLRAIRGRDVGFVFQDPLSSLNPVKPVGSLLIESARRHAKCSKQEATERAVSMLESVGIANAKERIFSFPHEFSGGQRQRIMIALAVINRPSLIVADEPTTALDATVQIQVLDLLKSRTGQGALLLITHDLRIAADICDHISVMRQGQIIEAGTADEIMSSPQDVYTKELIDAVPQFGSRHFFEGEEAAFISDEPVAELENVEVLFRSQGRVLRALDGVSLTIPRGAAVGVVGESGSGKSTIAKSIMQIVQPTSGAIYFDGKDVSKLSRKNLKALRRRIQMIFQDPYASLDPRWRVGRAISEPMHAQGIRSREKTGGRVTELVGEVGLPSDTAERLPVQFSGGQRQRICLARALTLTPDLLIADEPVSSLDVTTQWKIARLLKRIQKEYNLTLIFVAHDLPLVYQLTDRIVFLYFGQIVEEGKTEEVLTAPQHPYTAALLSASGVSIESSQKISPADFGEPGSVFDLPPGCRFHPRCPIARPKCKTDKPSLESIGGVGRVACHFPGEIRLSTRDA